jgi:hypothetical protein
MCDWRKLPRRVTSRPEIEISDKTLAFSGQTSSIEPSYNTGQKQVKMSISPIAQGFLKKFRVQNVALTVRRPKHPSLVWCIGIFLCETFSRLVPRDPNLAHHTGILECTAVTLEYNTAVDVCTHSCVCTHTRELNLVLKVNRKKLAPFSMCQKRARYAIYSRDTAIRISSVPRFIYKYSFVKIPSWDKVMGFAEYFCRPF